MRTLLPYLVLVLFVFKVSCVASEDDEANTSPASPTGKTVPPSQHAVLDDSSTSLIFANDEIDNHETPSSQSQDSTIVYSQDDESDLTGGAETESTYPTPPLTPTQEAVLEELQDIWEYSLSLNDTADKDLKTTLSNVVQLAYARVQIEPDETLDRLKYLLEKLRQRIGVTTTTMQTDANQITTSNSSLSAPITTTPTRQARSLKLSRRPKRSYGLGNGIGEVEAVPASEENSIFSSYNSAHSNYANDIKNSYYEYQHVPLAPSPSPPPADKTVQKVLVVQDRVTIPVVSNNKKTPGFSKISTTETPTMVTYPPTMFYPSLQASFAQYNPKTPIPGVADLEGPSGEDVALNDANFQEPMPNLNNHNLENHNLKTTNSPVILNVKNPVEKQNPVNANIYPGNANIYPGNAIYSASLTIPNQYNPSIEFPNQQNLSIKKPNPGNPSLVKPNYEDPGITKPNQPNPGVADPNNQNLSSQNAINGKPTINYIPQNSEPISVEQIASEIVKLLYPPQNQIPENPEETTTELTRPSKPEFTFPQDKYLFQEKLALLKKPIITNKNPYVATVTKTGLYPTYLQIHPLPSLNGEGNNNESYSTTTLPPVLLNLIANLKNQSSFIKEYFGNISSEAEDDKSEGEIIDKIGQATTLRNDGLSEAGNNVAIITTSSGSVGASTVAHIMTELQQSHILQGPGAVLNGTRDGIVQFIATLSTLSFTTKMVMVFALSISILSILLGVYSLGPPIIAVGVLGILIPICILLVLQDSSRSSSGSNGKNPKGDVTLNDQMSFIIDLIDKAVDKYGKYGGS